MSKRVTKSEPTYSKGLRCSFPPPLDVAILPRFILSLVQVVLLPDVTATLVVKKHALSHLSIGACVRAPARPFCLFHNLSFLIQCKQVGSAYHVSFIHTTWSSYDLISRTTCAVHDAPQEISNTESNKALGLPELGPHSFFAFDFIHPPNCS